MARNMIKIVTETETCETSMDWEMDRFVLVHLMVKGQPICSGNFTAAQQKSTFNLKLVQSKGLYDTNKKWSDSLVAALALTLVSCPKDIVSHKFFCELSFGGRAEKPYLTKNCQDFVVERCSKALLEIPWTEFSNNLEQILWENKLLISLKLTICVGEPKSINLIDIKAKEKAEDEDHLIIASLEKLFHKPEYFDVTIICGSVKLPAHKCILTGRSTVFDKMFQSKMKESAKNVVKIKDIEAKIMKLALEFIYTGKVNELHRLDSKSLIGLVGCAEKYDLQGLKLMSLEKLFNSISDKNAGQLAMTAYLYNIDPVLKTKVLEYCQSRHSTLIQDSEYRKLFSKTPQAFLS